MKIMMFSLGKLAAIFAALFVMSVPAAMAQTTVASPQITVGRRDDVLNKDVKNCVFFSWYNRRGQLIATRSVDENPQAVKLPQGYPIRLDAGLTNANVERFRWGYFPDNFEGLKSKDERVRKVFQMPYSELDKLDLGKGQALFSGDIDLRRARLGSNLLMLRAETRHASQVTILFASFTDWRRNYLNDGVPIVVVDMDERDLVLELKRNGWYFVDSKVDAQLTALTNGQTLPVTQVVEDRGQKADDRDHEVDTSKLDASPLTISIDGKTADGVASCNFSGSTITIDAGGSFRLCVYRVGADGKEELIKDKSYPDSPLRLEFSGTKSCEYRFEISARGQIVGVMTLKETK